MTHWRRSEQICNVTIKSQCFIPISNALIPHQNEFEILLFKIIMCWSCFMPSNDPQNRFSFEHLRVRLHAFIANTIWKYFFVFFVVECQLYTTEWHILDVPILWFIRIKLALESVTTLFCIFWKIIHYNVVFNIHWPKNMFVWWTLELDWVFSQFIWNGKDFVDK